MKYFWKASEAGLAEGTEKLAELYQKGEIVLCDTGESKRLLNVLMMLYKMTEDGLEWRLNENKKELYLRGNRRMQDYDNQRTPCE